MMSEIRSQGSATSRRGKHPLARYLRDPPPATSGKLRTKWDLRGRRGNDSALWVRSERVAVR